MKHTLNFYKSLKETFTTLIVKINIFRRNGKIAKREKIRLLLSFHDKIKGFFWLEKPFFYGLKCKKFSPKLPDL